IPLLALGRMDRREDQEILVEQRRSGKIAGRLRRVERKLAEELLARSELLRDALELQQVARPHLRCVVDALELGLEPLAGALHLAGPGLFGAPERTHQQVEFR